MAYEKGIYIRKNKRGPKVGMWMGFCTRCGKPWQYWAFGATLGAGLEHMRRCQSCR